MEWDNFQVWETNEGTVAGIQVRDDSNLSSGNGCEEKMMVWEFWGWLNNQDTEIE